MTAGGFGAHSKRLGMCPRALRRCGLGGVDPTREKGKLQMRIESFRRASLLTLSVLLLAGLTYSVVAITLTPESVHASSCDCNQALNEAMLSCLQDFHNWQVSDFQCPVSLGGTEVFLYKCVSDPSQTLRGAGCP